MDREEISKASEILPEEWRTNFDEIDSLESKDGRLAPDEVLIFERSRSRSLLERSQVCGPHITWRQIMDVHRAWEKRVGDQVSDPQYRHGVFTLRYRLLNKGMSRDLVEQIIGVADLLPDDASRIAFIRDIDSIFSNLLDRTLHQNLWIDVRRDWGGAVDTCAFRDGMRRIQEVVKLLRTNTTKEEREKYEPMLINFFFINMQNMDLFSKGLEKVAAIPQAPVKNELFAVVHFFFGVWEHPSNIIDAAMPAESLKVRKDTGDSKGLGKVRCEVRFCVASEKLRTLPDRYHSALSELLEQGVEGEDIERLLFVGEGIGGNLFNESQYDEAMARSVFSREGMDVLIYLRRKNVHPSRRVHFNKFLSFMRNTLPLFAKDAAAMACRNGSDTRRFVDEALDFLDRAMMFGMTAVLDNLDPYTPGMLQLCASLHAQGIQPPELYSFARNLQAIAVKSKSPRIFDDAYRLFVGIFESGYRAGSAFSILESFMHQGWEIVGQGMRLTGSDNQMLYKGALFQSIREAMALLKEKYGSERPWNDLVNMMGGEMNIRRNGLFLEHLVLMAHQWRWTFKELRQFCKQMHAHGIELAEISLMLANSTGNLPLVPQNRSKDDFTREILNIKRKCHVSRFGRLSLQVLDAANRGRRPGRKLAVFDIALADGNGALYHFFRNAERFIALGYDINLREVSREDDIYDHFRGMVKGGVDIWWVDAHAGPKAIGLGYGQGERSSLDINDMEIREFVKPYLAEKAQIIYDACSTARKISDSDLNLATRHADLLEHPVWANTVDGAVKNAIFNEEGDLEKIIFWGSEDEEHPLGQGTGVMIEAMRVRSK